MHSRLTQVGAPIESPSGATLADCLHASYFEAGLQPPQRTWTSFSGAVRVNSVAASSKLVIVMKIATYNVNGVNGRLPVLLRWLAEAKPDIVCLQELKAPDERFPATAIRDAGYGVIWHGQKSWNGVAILARGQTPVETRRSLLGDPDDVQSRYIEAAVNGLVTGCLYLPNGNPAPGPKFDYKLRWFQRLRKHARKLIASGAPVILAGDFNVMPTDLDVYKPERWLDDALFRPEVRAEYAKLLSQGWVDALRTLHPGERIYTFWDYFRNAYARNAGLRIDHLLLSPAVATRLKDAGVDRHVRGWEKASDHAPTWITLKRGKSRGGRLSTGLPS
jgi:exodeoxyribonuclease-3